MHELHEYSRKLKRPKQIKDAFGELHGSLIEVILANLYLFVAIGHKAKSEADLAYLIRQLFKRQFGVDVTQEYGEDYRRALRRTWRMLEQVKKTPHSVRVHVGNSFRRQWRLPDALAWEPEEPSQRSTGMGTPPIPVLSYKPQHRENHHERRLAASTHRIL